MIDRNAASVMYAGTSHFTFLDRLQWIMEGEMGGRDGMTCNIYGGGYSKEQGRNMLNIINISGGDVMHLFLVLI